MTTQGPGQAAAPTIQPEHGLTPIAGKKRRGGSCTRPSIPLNRHDPK